MHLLTNFHHPTFNRSEVIVFANKHVHKQTKRFGDKHPSISAMLSRLKITVVTPYWLLTENNTQTTTKKWTADQQGGWQMLCVSSCRRVWVGNCWQHTLHDVSQDRDQRLMHRLQTTTVLTVHVKLSTK